MPGGCPGSLGTGGPGEAGWLSLLTQQLLSRGGQWPDPLGWRGHAGAEGCVGARKPAARPVRHRSASWAGLLGTLCDFAGEHTPFSLSLRSLKPERLEKELDRFADRAQQAAGRRVGLAAFAAYLEVPVSDTLGDMFSLFDEVARPPGPGLGVGGGGKSCTDSKCMFSSPYDVPWAALEGGDTPAHALSHHPAGGFLP